MLYFAAPDFAVDSSDSPCVNTDTSPLCNVFANSHIRTKDTIEGVIAINENSRSKLTDRGPNARQDGSWDVEFVSTDGGVVSSDII